MPYPCQPTIEFLVTLDRFHQLTIFLFQVCSGGSMFHPLSTCCCFWSGVSKRGTYFENNLRIPKDSCKIVITLPSDIFMVSAISRNFNLRSPKTILWTFVMFSGTTADFGLPERSASSVFVRPRLNSAY